MNVREFARHIGVSHPAVSKACANGRLTERSVRRDARGRVVDIDPVEGAREWEIKGRLSPDELNGTRPLGGPKRPLPAAETAPQFELHLDEGAPSLVVRFPLGRFVAGAARALQETGKEPTPEAIRAVFDATDVPFWWATAVGALHSAIDMKIRDKDLPLMWEASGREAVLGEAKGAADVDE